MKKKKKKSKIPNIKGEIIIKGGKLMALIMNSAIAQKRNA